MATKQAHDRPAFAKVEDFLAALQGSTKTAEANTEAGSIGGATTHPVKSVPDNTRTPAPTGARFKENTSDVKEDTGKPSVDSTPDAKAGKSASEGVVGGSAESDQLQLGTKKAPTGEDPAVETQSAKGGKEDGGYQGSSTHPARTDNEALGGGKYAFDNSTPLTKLAEYMQDLGTEICADIVNSGYDNTKQANTTAAASPAGQQQATTNKAASIDPNLAQQVGWEMAGILNGTLDKQATDVMVVNQIEELIKAGEDNADRVYNWLVEYNHHKQAAAQKQAAGDEGPPPPPPGAGGPPGGGGDDMAAALGGGAGGPPGMPPEAGGGGDPAMEHLKQLLDQLGITPEQLEQAITAEASGGGGAGGPPPPGAGGPPGGGMPPEAAMAGASGPPGGGMEATAADTAAFKEAMANYVKEVVGRSRAIKAAAQATRR